MYKYDHENETVMPGYPRKISEDFPGLTLSNYDAVFHYYRDDAVYFYKVGIARKKYHFVNHIHRLIRNS